MDINSSHFIRDLQYFLCFTYNKDICFFLCMYISELDVMYTFHLMVNVNRTKKITFSWYLRNWKKRLLKWLITLYKTSPTELVWFFMYNAVFGFAGWKDQKSENTKGRWMHVVHFVYHLFSSYHLCFISVSFLYACM